MTYYCLSKCICVHLKSAALSYSHQWVVYGVVSSSASCHPHTPAEYYLDKAFEPTLTLFVYLRILLWPCTMGILFLHYVLFAWRILAWSWREEKLCPRWLLRTLVNRGPCLKTRACMRALNVNWTHWPHWLTTPCLHTSGKVIILYRGDRCLNHGHVTPLNVNWIHWTLQITRPWLFRLIYVRQGVILRKGDYCSNPGYTTHTHKT